MTFSLAQIPIEILAEITSALPSFKVLLALFLTGESRLIKKLNNGGVTKVLIDCNKLPEASFKFLKSINGLMSASFLGLDNPPYIWHYIRSLSSSLLHLKVDNRFWEEILILEGERAPIALSPGDAFSKSCWRVSDSYPRLQSLELGCKGLEPETPSSVLVTFLCGLPASITHLCAFCNELNNVNIWKALPPSLTSFETRNCFNRQLKIPSPFFESLRSLKFHLLDEHASRNHRDSNVAVSFVFPPNLTQLQLSCDADLPPSLILPRYLAHLTLESSLSQSQHPIHLFYSLPQSLTSFHFTCSNLIYKRYNEVGDDENDEDLDFNILTGHGQSFLLPNLKYLTLNMADYRLLHSLKDILVLAPNLSILHLNHDQRNDVLTPADISKLLNPTSLTSLSARLDEKCFVEYDGTYPLHSLLPNLLHLELFNYIEPNTRLAFLPPKIQVFVAKNGCQNYSLMAQSILSAPPSLTRLQVHVQFDLKNVPIFFFPPQSIIDRYTSSSNVIAAAADSSNSFPPADTKVSPCQAQVVDWSVADTSCLSIGRCDFVREFGSYGRFWMVPSESGFTKIWVTSSDTSSITSSPTLPSTCTSSSSPAPASSLASLSSSSLSIDCSRTVQHFKFDCYDSGGNGTNFAKIMSNLSTHLLQVEKAPCIPENFDMTIFNHLQILHLDDVGWQSFTSLPPNIRILRARGAIMFSDSCLPLPETLETLDIRSRLTPMNSIAPLPRLLHFTIPKLGDPVDWNQLPKSIETFHQAHEALISIKRVSNLFPHLKSIDVDDMAIPWKSIEFVRRLNSSKSLDIIGGRLNEQYTLSEKLCLRILSQMNIDSHSIHLDTCKSLSTYLGKVLHQIYPFWKKRKSNCASLPLPGAALRLALSLLSPSNTELILQDSSFTNLKRLVLPSCLNRLDFRDCLIPPRLAYNLSRDLPRTLESLIVDAKCFSLTTYRAMPPNLTSLELLSQSKFPPHYARALPQKLLFIHLTATNIPLDSLSALPTSLITLNLSEEVVTSKRLQAIPLHLQRLEIASYEVNCIALARDRPMLKWMGYDVNLLLKPEF